jgi:alanine-synthesizing transaminase
MTNFHRINLLPTYIFNNLAEMKANARLSGEDIIDFGMGNPDQPTPPHIVETLLETAKNPENHRYSLSKGITGLRQAISDWYQRQYQVSIDKEREAIATIGSKEGIAHLALAMVSPGDVVLVPSLAYPIHTYAFVIAGAQVKSFNLDEDQGDVLKSIKKAIETSQPLPKILVLNFPSNPTTVCVDLDFFEEVIGVAKKYGIWVLHDLAYADLVFDDYKAPSILQVAGAKEVAIECYTLSKSYNMPGWRVGFMCGNEQLVGALAKIKSYLDYGMFAPIQLAAITALNSERSCVQQICCTYKKRRDLLCKGLAEAGWEFKLPKASMFVWAKMPRPYRQLGSFEFAKQLLLKANIAVSPGIGFGASGDEFIRFSLIEDEARIKQAMANMQRMFRSEPLAEEAL